jgi:hypothetical protein
LVDFCGSGVAGLQTLVRLRTATGNTNGLLIQGNVTNDEMYINNFYNAALSFGTNNIERLRIDSSGNVGIGVTPSAWASNRKALQIGGSASAALALNGTSNVSELFFNSFINNLSTNVYAVNGRSGLIAFGSGGLTFNIDSGTQVAGDACNFTPAVTVDVNRNLLIGTGSPNASWATRLTLSTDTGTTRWAVGPYVTATNFIISASGSFGVYLNGTSAVSWTGISDERLKDIIEPISNAVAKVGQLRSVIGKFKSDETNTRRSFLLAQDVQAVLPEAVDASNPDRLGVAYTDVIPLLVAAIKELTARVQTLETR